MGDQIRDADEGSGGSEKCLRGLEGLVDTTSHLVPRNYMEELYDHEIFQLNNYLYSTLKISI